MTKQGNQGTTSAISAFSRSRRASAAVAFSLGLGSLVYGTVLSFPAAAASGTATSVTCTTTATPAASSTKSTASGASGAPAPTASASVSVSASASQSSDPTASVSTSASQPATVPPSTTPCATESASASAGGSSSASSTSTATASSSASASASKSASATTTTAKATTSVPAKGGPTATINYTASQVPVYVVAPTGSYFQYVDVPPGNAASQWPHGTISRAEIMARAQLWVKEQVPYSQTTWKTDQNGTYRQDCSGYVSMAWNLDQNTDFWTGNLNLVSQTIAPADLLPGDILLSVEHTILFAGWADPQHTSFDYYEEAHPGTVARYVVDAPLAAFLDNGFGTFRYDGVVNGGAIPANPSAGALYASLAKLASEINPPGVNPSLTGGPTTASKKTTLSAQAAADDVAGSGGSNGGMALAAGGAFLVGAGLLMRKPGILRTRRGKH